MERQAGLGRSLEDVLDSLTPVDPTDQAPTHALFGIAPEDALVANGTSVAHATKNKKNTKSKKKKKKADGDKKKKKKKKKKSKGKKRPD
jgi:hypothetical protein